VSVRGPDDRRDDLDRGGIGIAVGAGGDFALLAALTTASCWRR
jgi:hypothetical protein